MPNINFIIINPALAWSTLLVIGAAFLINIVWAVRCCKNGAVSKLYTIGFLLRMLGLIAMALYYYEILYAWGGFPRINLVWLSRLGEMMFILGASVYVPKRLRRKTILKLEEKVAELEMELGK